MRRGVQLIERKPCEYHASDVCWGMLTGRHPAPHTYCITLSKGLPFRRAFSLDEKKTARVGDRGNLLRAYFSRCGYSVDEKKPALESGPPN